MRKRELIILEKKTTRYGITVYNSGIYREHPLYFLDIGKNLKRDWRDNYSNAGFFFLGLLDELYVNTNQDECDWALEYHLWCRNLFAYDRDGEPAVSLMLNPRYLSIYEDDVLSIIAHCLRDFLKDEAVMDYQSMVQQHVWKKIAKALGEIAQDYYGNRIYTITWPCDDICKPIIQYHYKRFDPIVHFPHREFPGPRNSDRLS